MRSRAPRRSTTPTDAAQAAAIFARYHSLEAQIGSAFVAWPKDGLATVQEPRRRAPGERRRAPPPRHRRLLGRPERRRRRRLGEGRQASAPTRRTGSRPRTSCTRATCQVPGLPYLVLDFRPPPAIGKLPAAAATRRARQRRCEARTPGRSSSTAPRSGASSVRSRPSGSSRLQRSSHRTTRSHARPRLSARSRRRTR